MATLVFVHGTTTGGWVWKHIASRLRDAGEEEFGQGEPIILLHDGPGDYRYLLG